MRFHCTWYLFIFFLFKVFQVWWVHRAVGGRQIADSGWLYGWGDSWGTYMYMWYILVKMGVCSFNPKKAGSFDPISQPEGGWIPLPPPPLGSRPRSDKIFCNFCTQIQRIIMTKISDDIVDRWWFSFPLSPVNDPEGAVCNQRPCRQSLSQGTPQKQQPPHHGSVRIKG